MTEADEEVIEILASLDGPPMRFGWIQPKPRSGEPRIRIEGEVAGQDWSYEGTEKEARAKLGMEPFTSMDPEDRERCEEILESVIAKRPITRKGRDR